MKNEALAPVHETRGAEAFLERVAGIIDAGAQSVMISIGHRTGLFDVMSRLPAASSAKIVAESELSERYVREWLAVMVTAGIVEYDPRDESYHLPSAHAACLTHDPMNVWFVSRREARS